MVRTRRPREPGPPPIIDITWRDDAGNVIDPSDPRIADEMARRLLRVLMPEIIDEVVAERRPRDEPALRNAAARSRSHTMQEKEVASLLGVSVASVREAVAQNAIPHRCVGREVVFSRRRILAWLDDQR